MNIAIFLVDGRVCNLRNITRVVLQEPGSNIVPEPGVAVLSPMTLVAWVTEPEETDEKRPLAQRRNGGSEVAT